MPGGVSAELVEQIVREVLSRLTGDRGRLPVAPVGAPLTLADVESLPPGSRLEIGTATVITPAARDELRRRRIELVRTSVPTAGPRPDVPILTQTDRADELQSERELIIRTIQVIDGAAGVLVLARRPHRVAAQLNRESRIEAAVVRAGQEESLGEPGFLPNVLVAPRYSPRALPPRWSLHLAEMARKRKSNP